MIKILDKKTLDRSIYVIKFESNEEVLDFVKSNKITKPISLAIIENNFINNVHGYDNFFKALVNNQIDSVAIFGDHSKSIEDEIDDIIVKENIENDDRTIMTTAWDTLKELLEYTILSSSSNKNDDYKSCVILLYPGVVSFDKVQEMINFIS
mgnify:CR=1 FL=1